MKMKKIMLLVAVASSLVLMACDMYDGGIPSKSVRKEFKAMYPEARDVEWDREGVHWSVSFEIGTSPNVVEYEAMYDRNGNWLMTEHDVPFSAVPENIRKYLSSSHEYGILPLDDNEVKYYQTPSGNFYRFDLVKEGRDIDVDVSEDGKVSLAKKDRF